MNKKNNDFSKEFSENNSFSNEFDKNNNLRLEKTAKIVAIAMFFILTILIFYILFNFSGKKEIVPKSTKSNVVNVKLNGRVVKTSLENQFIIIETDYNPSSKTQEIIKIDSKNGNEISRIILNF